MFFSFNKNIIFFKSIGTYIQASFFVALRRLGLVFEWRPSDGGVKSRLSYKRRQKRVVGALALIRRHDSRARHEGKTLLQALVRCLVYYDDLC